MTILLVILYVLVCLFLIMVVLLQQGKGADLAGAFGGGGSQTSFGPRAGTNLMHRMTTASFVLFVVLSMALAILSGKARTSVMEDVETLPPAGVVEQVPGETLMESADEGASEGAAAGEPAEGDQLEPVAGDDAEAAPPEADQTPEE